MERLIIITETNRLSPAKWLVWVVCIILLTGCNCSVQPTPTPFPTLAPTPTPPNIPDFVLFYSPPAGSPIFEGNVTPDINVWVAIDQDVLQSPGENLPLADLEGRAKLFIDGNQVEHRITEYVFCYEGSCAQVEGLENVNVDFGQHTATLKVYNGNGEEREFSWVFEVVAKDPSIMPGLPYEFQFVRPIPDSVITSKAYYEDDLVPSIYLPGMGDLAGAVCAGVIQERIVESGEHLDRKGVVQKLTFVSLDNEPPTEVDERTCEVDLLKVVDADRSYAGNNFVCCWKKDLEPGEHHVVVRVEKSEPVEFSWWFIIEK